MQIALIVSARGGEVLFCTARKADPLLVEAQARLVAAPDALIARVEGDLPDGFRFRPKWRLDPDDAEDIEDTAAARWRARLSPAIAERRTAHVAGAARIAARLFVEKPNGLRRRLAAIWTAGR